jgi:ACDE family multidrug resistance protein
MSERKLYKDRNLHIIFGVTLMAVLGVASITPAFPKIIRELGISEIEIGLLITVFTLPGLLLSPFTGMLADRFGRKKILVPSLFLFAIAGTSCALVKDFNLLLLLRAFQGLGAISLGAINTTIVGDLYTGKERAEAMGLNASVLSIGTGTYPVIGGALALLGWNYPFILPILAIPVGLFVMKGLKNPEPENFQGLKTYLTGVWENLKNLKVLALFGAQTFNFIMIYGTFLTYFVLLMAEKFDASSLTIGIIMSAESFTTAVIATQLGTINKRVSLVSLIKISFLIAALAMALIPVMPFFWLLLIPAMILGIGGGIAIPSLYTLVAGIAPIEYRGAFMSLNSTMLRLGQTIGPPLIGLIYVSCGMNNVFYITAGAALAAPVIATIVGSSIKSKPD